MRNNLIIIACIVVASASRAESLWEYLPSKDQEKIREERPFAIGLPFSAPYDLPGQYQFRPSGRWTLGATFVSEALEEAQLELEGDHTVTGEQTSTSFYFEHYLPRAYGFHIGGGIERRRGSFSLLAIDEQGDAKVVAEGRYDAIYAGPSFGWTWIWDWGLTIGFDLSQRKRFAYSFDVTAEADESVRKALVPKTTSGMILVGYSF